MTPRRLRRELRLRVLRIVDQQVDTFDQFERTRRRRVAAVEWLLVIRQVRDRMAVELDAEAERRAEVRNEARLTLNAPIVNSLSAVSWNDDDARQLVDADGEQRRANGAGHDLLERATVVLCRAVHVEAGRLRGSSGAKNGRPWTWSQCRWVSRQLPRNNVSVGTFLP